MNENILYGKLDRINFKINFLLFVLIVLILYSYWMYLKVGAYLTYADILLQQAETLKQYYNGW